MRITKRQLKQIIQEELAGVIREGFARDIGKGVGAVTDFAANLPAKAVGAVKKVGSEFLSGFDSQTDVRVPASGRKPAAMVPPVPTGPVDFNDVDIHGELIPDYNDEMDDSTGDPPSWKEMYADPENPHS